MTNDVNLAALTPYQDINDVLILLSNNMKAILGENLIGLYLFGSLAYGDFNPDSSDIDVVAMIDHKLNPKALAAIKEMHKTIGEFYLTWQERLECSYTPIAMLKVTLPPLEPRPYYGGGIFYDAAPYGNEWIINNYLLYEHGVTLLGVDFKTLMQPINILDVQKACIRDLFAEWEPKISDAAWLNNSHYQAYLVLNLCRILYTVMCAKTGTKKVSAEWVKNKFGSAWHPLIDAAQQWKYGMTVSFKKETIAFLRFTIDQIKHTDVYRQMNVR